MQDFYRLIREKVAEYAALPENLNNDGSVNWSFVDADICLDLNMTPACHNEYYLPAFERAVDNYLGKEGSLAAATGWIGLEWVDLNGELL